MSRNDVRVVLCSQLLVELSAGREAAQVIHEFEKLLPQTSRVIEDHWSSQESTSKLIQPTGEATLTVAPVGVPVVTVTATPASISAGTCPCIVLVTANVTIDGTGVSGRSVTLDTDLTGVDGARSRLAQRQDEE